MSRLLVVTAVEAERTAVCEGLDHASRGRIGPFETRITASGAGEVTLVTAGVGPIAAAAATAAAFAGSAEGFDIALSLGVGGAFEGQGAGVGDVVVATRMVAADLSAWGPAGFLDVRLDGTSGTGTPEGLREEVVGRLQAAGLRVATGPVLTLSAMTTDPAAAATLAERHGAVAEAMEGAAVGYVAERYGRPALEARTVSNLVGAAEEERWLLDEALAGLTATAAALFALPLPLPPPV